MITECAECGKQIVILYPFLWVYKRNVKQEDGNYRDIYFCSWRCTRAEENRKRVEEKKKMDRREERLFDFLERIGEGTNARDALKDMGIVGPKSQGQTYRQLREYALKAGGMQLGELLPKTLQEAEKIDFKDMKLTVNRNKKPQEVEKLTLEEGKNYQMSVAETSEKKKEEKQFLPLAVLHPELGEFYFDRRHNMMEWRTEEGDEISMEPQAWKKLVRDLPQICKEIGVALG